MFYRLTLIENQFVYSLKMSRLVGSDQMA